MVELSIFRFVNALPISGSTQGLSSESLFTLHVALVRLTVVFFLPMFHGLPETLELLLVYMFLQSLRVCLGVLRAMTRTLVLSESKVPSPRNYSSFSSDLNIFLRPASFSRPC